jgi:Leucine-rich repeat (LRR) protein
MNHLETLPPEMGRLTSLTALDASDNRLRAIPASALGGARALARVAARSNALTELPESVGCLTALTALDVSMNRLAGLPESFTQLTALEHVS